MNAREALAQVHSRGRLSVSEAHAVLREAGIPIFASELETLAGGEEIDRASADVMKRLVAELDEERRVLLDAVLDRVRL